MVNVCRCPTTPDYQTGYRTSTDIDIWKGERARTATMNAFMKRVNAPFMAC
jgi:hypothetical protein